MKNVQLRSEQLEEQLPAIIEETWGNKKIQVLLDEMVAEAQRLHTAFAKVGDDAYQRLQAGPQGDLDTGKDYQLTFEWADRAKSFLILWRDVLFQLQKAHLLQADDRLGEEALPKLLVTSKATLLQAAASLTEQYKRAQKTAAGRNFSRNIRNWRHQLNPWPTYREQMAKIPEQCAHIRDTHLELLAGSDIFDLVRKEVTRMENRCREEVEKTEEVVVRTIRLIEKEISEDPNQSLGKIAALLEDVASENVLPNHLTDFTSQLESLIDHLPENMAIPVAVDQGLLEIREIPLRRRIRQWLESEILPSVYEEWEISEGVHNGLRMALVNIRNRALLLSAGTREGKAPDYEQADISHPLQALLGAEKQAQTVLASLREVTQKRMREAFHLSLVYDTSSYFLPISLQSTINQLQLNQNRVLVRLRRWLRFQLLSLRRFRRNVEQEEALSVLEKVARYLNTWEGNPGNSHYTSIFLTRGYIGESFAVGRKEELARVGSVIRQWKKGYGGAVGITGKRFSGKTLFGELVANRFFPDSTIRLAPGETIQVQGRKLKVSYDLKEALEFVRKYTLNVKAMIWLDDLELWWDPDFPLLRNVRMLTRFIDSYSQDIFFLVALNNSLRARLQLLTGVDRIFHSEFNMDYMTPAEIRDAILIRHGATHTVLVDESGEEVSPQQFNKLTQQVHRSARGNIGDALMRWAGTTKKRGEEQVMSTFSPRNPLPDFLSPESGMLLSSIMLQKRTNEYRLRKLFGPAFAEKYRSTLMRLLNAGLVRRQLDGWLEINEVAASDVGYLLERKKFLRYQST